MYDYKKSVGYIIKKAREAQKIFIVGASKTGKQLLAYLRNRGLCVEAFLDNNMAFYGQSIDGVKIICPRYVQQADRQALYIIASINFEDELHRQLEDMGIPASSIISFCARKGYEYFCELEEGDYEAELQDIYYRRFEQYLNLENPSTYNEKINWQKLYDKDPRKTRLSDKYLVREWIKETIGEKYLTRLYGVWNDAEDIDFSLLPEKYALKLNHGAGWNIIVNGNEVEEDRIRKQLNEWKNQNFAYYSFEMHYEKIEPKIICEEYLENNNGDLYDYKVFCFHGEPKYIMFLAERNTNGLKMVFYDTEWRKQPFVYSYPMYEKEVDKPDNLDEMLEMSRILSKGFSQVRVDWYSLERRLVFGEMTFTSYSGFCKWNPEEYNQLLGALI